MAEHGSSRPASSSQSADEMRTETVGGRHRAGGCGGAVGCLLFVAAGGGRGRGDLCRCGQTGALKTTPGRTPHMRRACRCRRGATTTTTIRQPGRRSVGWPGLALPANPTCRGWSICSIRPSGVLVRSTDGRTASAAQRHIEREDREVNCVAYRL